MRRKLCLSLSVASMLTLAVGACADDTVASSGVDASVPTDGGTSDGPVAPAPDAADATAAPDSSVGVGSCTPSSADAGSVADAAALDAGVECHQLANCAADVPFTTGTGAAPTPAGGTLPDGIYALTAAIVYGAVAPPGMTLTVTQVKQGSTIYTTAHSKSSPQDGRAVSTVAFSGTDMTGTQICPGSGVQARKFTATSTKLLDFDIDPKRTVVYEYTLVQ